MRNSIGLRTVGTAALLALIIGQSVWAAVEPGVEYAAGTRVDTPGTGVEFTIPQGWTGILPKGGTFFVLGSPTQKAYIFIIVEDKTLNETKEMMSKPLSLGNGLSLTPVGEIQSQGSALIGNYAVAGAKEPMAGYVEARITEGGKSVTHVAISSPETATGVQQVVHKLSEETVLEKS
jgi:hypothetical protein